MDTEATDILLEFTDVGYQFPGSTNPVISNLNFGVGKNEFIAFLGPSGCGKSTVLRLLAGLLTPTTGQLQRKSEHDAQESVNMVFQNARLVPWLTVRENLKLPSQLHSQHSKPTDEDFIQAINLVGMTEGDLSKFPRMLSGGMKMRVSLARALLGHPEIILFDEPFSAVDDLLRYQLNLKLRQIWQTGNWAGVLVTHQIEEALFLSQRLFLLSSQPAKVIEMIPVQEILGENSRNRDNGDLQKLANRVREIMFQVT